MKEAIAELPSRPVHVVRNEMLRTVRLARLARHSFSEGGLYSFFQIQLTSSILVTLINYVNFVFRDFIEIYQIPLGIFGNTDDFFCPPARILDGITHIHPLKKRICFGHNLIF